MRSAVHVLVVSDDALPPIDADRPDRPLEVVGPVPVEHAVSRIVATEPDVVLLDGRMVELIPAIRLTDPRVKILIRAEPGGHSALPELLGAGACGVVSPMMDPDAVGEAVVRAALGELVLEDEDLSAIVRELAHTRRRPVAGLACLTNREREILRALADGLSTDEIATRFTITALTVRSHIKNILAKLGVHSKVEAVAIAWRDGLVVVPA